MDPSTTPSALGSFRPSRRSLLAAMVSVPLLAGTAACGDSSPSNANKTTELSFFWWGAQGRADLPDKALALYPQKPPNVTFKKPWQANQGYFDKLATLTAGGNPPDIFQIDDNYISDYATRNVT